MGTELLQCGSCKRRRGVSRAVVFFLAVLLAAAAGGCGKNGDSSQTDSVKVADAEALNEILAQEMSLVESYAPSLALARGRARALALRLRSQDQAHVDALEKSLRGVGGKAIAEPLPLEAERPASEAEALTLAYEEENAALSQALGSVPHLETSAPRRLASALAASHAQHLVVLRRLLGAGLAASVPAPFEPGDEPPPEQR